MGRPMSGKHREGDCGALQPWGAFFHGKHGGGVRGDDVYEETRRRPEALPPRDPRRVYVALHCQLPSDARTPALPVAVVALVVFVVAVMMSEGAEPGDS